ncbi:Acetyltransferase (GNAT) family protein [Roseivivax lentus]|uniref:Acetyltransferase (GNAT) family protein n=1 Tax=Roseivivax lentus TaxID=633194 RepID=A0A1N7PRJ5_9RHOB|nr:GNAT family N-acetyltransferase [Roseivivax lentus]SIT13079.1 Acetyltransferase (GNAT) family protein [Roseivivax lentus]
MQIKDHPIADEAAALGVRYRACTDADMDFLQRVYRSTREDELALTGWSEDEKAAFIAMQFNAQHSHYRAHYPDALWLVIEREGTPIGRLYLERWDREHRIIDIALLPDSRGHGIGGAILVDLQREARAAGGKALSIHVEKNNPAMALYHRLGFVRTEDKGVYDLMRWPAERTAALAQVNTAS